MFVAKSDGRENFRFRLEPALKTRWVEACEGLNMKQQALVESLVAWFCHSASDTQQTEISRFRPPGTKSATKNRPGLVRQQSAVKNGN